MKSEEKLFTIDCNPAQTIVVLPSLPIDRNQIRQNITPPFFIPLLNSMIRSAVLRKKSSNRYGYDEANEPNRRLNHLVLWALRAMPK